MSALFGLLLFFLVLLPDDDDDDVMMTIRDVKSSLSKKCGLGFGLMGVMTSASSSLTSSPCFLRYFNFCRRSC